MICAKSLAYMQL